MRRFTLTVLVLLLAAACGSSMEQRRKVRVATGGDPLLLPLDQMPPPGPPSLPAFPTVVTETLDNGLEVVVLPMASSATVSVRVIFPGGESTETPAEYGACTLLAEALRMGTLAHDERELAERIDWLGSSINMGCGADAFQAEAEMVAERTRDTVELLAEMLRVPSFPAAELARGKEQMQTWLAYADSQSEFMAMRRIHHLLYGQDPYGRYAPTADQIRAVDRDAIVAFHARALRPRGAVVVAAGATTPEAFFDIARLYFGPWKDAGAPPRAAPLPTSARPEDGDGETIVRLVDRGGAVQATVAVARRAIPRSHADYVALRVTDEILGGGPSRRLFQDLRERRGLTYGAGSDVDARARGGHVVATAEVGNAKVGEALDALQSEVRRIREEPVPRTELDEATRYLAGALAIRLDDPRQVASLVARQRLLNLPADEWRSWAGRVRAVSVSDVTTMAQRYLPTSHDTIVVVGDAEALHEQLSERAKVVVEVADPTDWD